MDLTDITILLVGKALPSNPDDITTLAEELSTSSIGVPTSLGDVTSISSVLKTTKNLLKEVTAQKKDVVAPFEAARKQCELAFEDAKQAKKTASKPYDDIKRALTTLDTQGRTEIAQYSENERARIEAEYKAKQELLDQSQALLQKAKDIVAEAVDTNSDEKFQQAQELKIQSDEAFEQYHDIDETPEVQSAIHGVSISHYIDYVISDLTLVPDSFIDIVVDEEYLHQMITSTFSGVTIVKLEVDVDKVDSQYRMKQVNSKAVVEYLKKDDTNVIPGITKLIKDRTIVKS